LFKKYRFKYFDDIYCIKIKYYIWITKDYNNDSFIECKYDKNIKNNIKNVVIIYRL